MTSLVSGQQLTSHAVIVATGSTYRRLDVPGEDELLGAGVHFCATCDGPFYKGVGEVVVIGLKPNSAFLGDAAQRDPGGFLVTDATMQTSLPGVFAAGDVRRGSTKQLGSAVGDGIAALLMTRRYLEAHHHKAVALADA